LWLFIAVIISQLIVIFAGVTTPVYDAAPIPENPVIITVVPQDEGAYFVVENNEITFREWPNEGLPCYYLMSGRVLDMDGEPFTEFAVNIKTIPLEGIITEGPGYALPGDGSFSEDGTSGWATMLPQWQISYQVWLTSEIGGRELSPVVIVPARDCDQNWAVLNFIQVRLLP
jgi:hypothetical protein